MTRHYSKSHGCIQHGHGRTLKEPKADPGPSVCVCVWGGGPLHLHTTTLANGYVHHNYHNNYHIIEYNLHVWCNNCWIHTRGHVSTAVQTLILDCPLGRESALIAPSLQPKGFQATPLPVIGERSGPKTHGLQRCDCPKFCSSVDGFLGCFLCFFPQ